MVASYVAKLILLIALLGCGAKLGADALSMDYYMMSCPFMDQMVRSTVYQALRRDPTLAAALLRLHFHDCFVQGCDASVLIDSTEDNTAEKDSPANLSLRGYEVIDRAKQLIEDQCPGVVSCADIVAMAARDAVFWAGGPFYEIPKGRKDGWRSKIEDTVNLPAPTLNVTVLVKMFGQHGFDAQELVALSGAHTLGAASCASFKNRLSNFDSDNGVDPTLDTDMARTLWRACAAGDGSRVPFDRSSYTFDSGYFNALRRGLGLLSSDQALFADPRTRPVVNAYAMNDAMFFLDFQQAILKMGLLDVKEGGRGEVRRDCRRVN
ncbi:peroxidase 47-like [Musa acuminata AAA Group]|uniref:peroxidase 47-like n=1 Tax=Musa acuminata AAA Group TaxID=214697 RepID=UPI0031D3C07E